MKSKFRRVHSNRFAQVALLVSLLCFVCGDSSAQDFRTVHPGVEYARVDHKIGNDPVKIDLLRLDLKKVRLDVHHALDRSIGVEQTSSIASRHRAVAAINAGFFRLDKSAFAGDAAGILIIDGEMMSESERDRIALRILNGKRRTEVSFGHRSTQAWFTFGARGSEIKLSGINRERKDGEIVAYDSSFGAFAPVAAGGTDLVLTNCKRSIVKKRVTRACKDARIVERATQTAIPAGGYVISLGADERVSKQALLRDLATYLANGGKNTYGIRVSDSIYGPPEETEDSVAGVPQLIKDGRIDITWEREKAGRSFVEARHPRTAVAKLSDGKLLLLTIDGRQPGVSVGMNLQELAEYLLSIGATDAMNLDGGGSTTMFVDGKVVNTPSDKEGERKVSDALVVTLRR